MAAQPHCTCSRIHHTLLCLFPAACLQLAAVEVLPALLDQHPGIRLVVIDSVTFHFRQVG